MQNTHHWAEMHFEMSDTQAATGVSDQYEVGKIGSLGANLVSEAELDNIASGSWWQYDVLDVPPDGSLGGRWWEGSVELPINWYMRGELHGQNIDLFDAGMYRYNMVNS